MKTFDHKKIEKKWQKVWDEQKVFNVEEDPKKEKEYLLVEFPYPSGDGLHVGHVRSYTAMDVIARKKRAEGKNVLYPIGWDAFGLPTENYAIKTGIQPKIVTKQNTDNFRRQLKSLGFSFDWSREINTTDPKYYKWTQWIFLKLFEKDLAYKAKMPINWCLSCKIGLANEEVVDGVCERCGGEVEKREKEQWMLKITEYADRLYDDLDTVDYWDRIKIQQRNWIGRSEGAEIDFPIVGSDEKISVFTTRPDTIFGATYMVLAPEHFLVNSLRGNIENIEEVQKYQKKTAQKTEIERTAEGKEKTGVELKGVRAINPANKEEIPVFIADYVLADYGTGAIMAVPSHDERDSEFAKKFDLPEVQVIEPVLTQTTGTSAFHSNEPAEDVSGIIAIVKHWKEDKYIGLSWPKVQWGTFLTGGIDEGYTPEETVLKEIREETGYTNAKIVSSLGLIHSKYYHVPKEANRIGHAPTFYVELQNDSCGEVDQEELKKHELKWLTKEELKSFLTATSHLQALSLFEGEKYTGYGVLKNSGQFDGLESEGVLKDITEYVGGKMRTTFKLRDWVFSRQRYWGEPIPMVHCEKCGWIPVAEKDLPVTLPEVEKYEPTDSGESPLAAMENWIKTECPKCDGEARRETDTMPNWAGSSWYYLRYVDPKNDTAFASEEKLKYWTPVDWYNGGMEHTTLHLLYSRFWHKFLFDLNLVPTIEPYKKRTSHGLILAEGGAKMSKSKGNTVSPDEVVENVGADTLRVYEMFMGPFDQAIAWNTDNMVGARRWLERVWRLKDTLSEKISEDTERELHKTIQKIGEDIEELKFNTAVSQMMIFVNTAEREGITKEQYATFIKVFAPFAPHLSEEVWQDLGNETSVHLEKWPEYDAAKLISDTMTIAVQINGKVRATIEMARDSSESDIKKQAREAAGKWIEGEEKNVIYVSGRLVNFVI